MSVPAGRIARSFFFLRRVWGLLAADRALQGVALLATVLNVLAAVLVFGGAAAALGDVDERVLVGVIGAVLAFPVTAIGTFCNVALLRMAEARFDGRRCTAREGFAAARKRLPAILAWSLLAVGIGALLRQIAERVPFGGAVLSRLLGVAWSLATMFAVPVLALEDAGARRAVLRSAELFRARWGEGMTGAFTVGAATTLVSLPAVVMVVLGLAAGTTAGTAVAGLGVALGVAAMTVSRALDQLFALALYRHETRGAASFGLVGGQLDRFVAVKRR